MLQKEVKSKPYGVCIFKDEWLWHIKYTEIKLEWPYLHLQDIRNNFWGSNPFRYQTLQTAVNAQLQQYMELRILNRCSISFTIGPSFENRNI